MKSFLLLALIFYLFANSQQNSIQCLSQLEDAQDTMFSLRENILAGNILDSFKDLTKVAIMSKDLNQFCEGHIEELTTEQEGYLETINCEQGLAYISIIIDDILMDVDIAEVLMKVVKFGTAFQKKCLTEESQVDGPNMFLNGLKTIGELTNLLENLQEDRKKNGMEQWIEEEKIQKILKA